MWIFMCNLRGNNKPRRFAGKFWFCGMEKAAAPADEGARTGNEWRSASPFRRRAQDPRSSTDSQAGGFWYAVIFSASINAAVRRKCSISTQRTRAICEANRAKRGGFAAAAALRRSRNAARPPTRGRERGMSGEARAPSGGGRKTRAAVQIRRQAAFGMPSYFPPQLTPQYGENAASPRSARARFAKP